MEHEHRQADQPLKRMPAPDPGLPADGESGLPPAAEHLDPEAKAPTEGGETVDLPEHPSLYIASLADYNYGRLHGTWVDMTMDLEDVHQAIAQMLKASPVLRREGETYGDWAIHDDDNFGMIRPREGDDLDVLHAVAVGIASKGEAFSAWADSYDRSDLRELVTTKRDLEALFNEEFLGEHETLQHFGETVIEDMGWMQQLEQSLPEAVLGYTRIDAEALASDMWLGSEIRIVHRPGGGVWIFREPQ